MKTHYLCLVFDCLLDEFRKKQFNTEQHSKFKSVTKRSQSVIKKVISTKSCKTKNKDLLTPPKPKLTKICTRISRRIYVLYLVCWIKYCRVICKSYQPFSSFQSSMMMHFGWTGLRIKEKHNREMSKRNVSLALKLKHVEIWLATGVGSFQNDFPRLSDSRLWARNGENAYRSAGF